jgi:hypothetical protein
MTLQLILQFSFIILAAICKALVDTIAFHKGGVFKSKFFDINTQGKFLPLTKYPLDGFHLANSFMLFFFILGITGFNWKLAAAGVLFIAVFNLFWNHIFNKKNKQS